MEKTISALWKMLETLYAKKFMANRLVLKQRLYTFHMDESEQFRGHISQFIIILNGLKNIEVHIDDEDQIMLLLCSLPPSYKYFKKTLIYDRDKLSFKDVKGHLLSKDKLENEFGSDSKLSSPANYICRVDMELGSHIVYEGPPTAQQYILSWRLLKSRNEFIFTDGHGSSRNILMSSLAWACDLYRRALSQNYGLRVVCCATLMPAVLLNLLGNIGSTGIYQAEARLLLQGLNLAWDRGFYRVEVEPDNALLIELVKLGLDDPHVRVKIRHIRGLCRKNWLLQLRNVKREVNGCADQLARIGGSLRIDTVCVRSSTI
ncbi:hypothetical protein CXB51_023185 [Gossypium anomalum]|uniref:RNase H type-1 domain-containing protein n=1 Tax=Gossypium anomalum TaxID=47600 RepID=A0A8J5YJZ8_9ROSI|nr:hypothetical protein CXB51_023185 [Gossypium anomalum]